MHSAFLFSHFNFIYLCMAAHTALLLRRLFSGCGEWGLVVVLRPLIAVASLVAHGLWGAQASVVAAHRLSSCGA